VGLGDEPNRLGAGTEAVDDEAENIPGVGAAVVPGADAVLPKEVDPPKLGGGPDETLPNAGGGFD